MSKDIITPYGQGHVVHVEDAKKFVPISRYLLRSVTLLTKVYFVFCVIKYNFLTQEFYQDQNPP